MPTKIEWCDETWNPITGCTPISEGCQNCYARRMTARNLWGYDFRPGMEHMNRYDQPSHWRKPRRIFVCSMGDLFHDQVTDSQINRVFATMTHPMGGANHHTYILLTKRPERILSGHSERFAEWPNIWLGVTAENQKRWEERVHILRQIPCAVRFVSVEPALEHIVPKMTDLNGLNSVDWIIWGPETGPGARKAKTIWRNNLYRTCAYPRVPFFDKSPEKWIAREWPKT